MNDIQVGDCVVWKGNPYAWNAFIGIRKVVMSLKGSYVVELNPLVGYPKYYNKQDLELISLNSPIRMSDKEYLKYISKSYAIDSEFLKMYESKTKIYPIIKVNIINPQLNFN